MSGLATLSWKSWQPTYGGRYLPIVEIPEQGTSLEGIEKELIEIALKQAGGNQTRAAHLLDISRDTLRYRIKKFELATDSRHRANGHTSETSEPVPISASSSEA
jgi:transcriptional regulator with AAA-type ATPase domain